ncbi:MAG: hypothetical protein WCX77_03960 [Candidatus Paceibacterota bacterium]|jgi:hypothetical protein
MANQQLFDYIKQETNKGSSKNQIKKGLSSAGWREADIDEAFAAVESPDYIPAPRAPMAADTNPIEDGNLIDAFSLLKKSFKVYKSRFWTLIGISAVPALLMFLFSLASISLSAKIQALEAPFVPMMGLLWFLISLSIQFWSQIALLCAIKGRNEKIEAGESFRRAWPKINSFAWVSILTGLIVMGGLMLFIIPGIIFSIWFCFASYILISENIGGMGALTRSRAYVQGYWWDIFWRFITLGLILIGPFIILAMILEMATAGITLTAGKANASIFSDFINFLITTFLTPFFATYSFLLYENLKQLKGFSTFEPKNKA